MNLIENKSLQSLNTFGINVKAKLFIEIESSESAQELFASETFKSNKHLILGGGSNVLLTSDFDGLVIHNKIKGIETEESDDTVKLVVGAGEPWHDFVLHCINQGYAGIENLSLIPGSVGASPMQNIGAYGVEVKDFIHQVEAIEMATGKIRVFKNSDCQFGYRSSIFKTSHKDRYFITKVHFQLLKKPVFKIEYGAIQEKLKTMGVKESELSIRSISDAVISIRKSKLPDPSEIGNSGSFFKNPVVLESKYQELRLSFPDLPAYPAGEGQYKLAAGWLIEKGGWKGFREKDFGVHKKQALVLVNYGSATGTEIHQLSKQIIKDIESKFGILLEREVNII